VSDAIVVLTATRNRPRLLAERWRPSLLEQSRPPDRVLVVDDSDARSFDANSRVIDPLPAHGVSVEIVRNEPTVGLAASWNRGIHRLVDLYGDCWLATLDDDDRWLPAHLCTCLAAAQATGATAAVPGITVIRDGRKIPLPIPRSLGVQAFLRGNPGWQGSTIFIRLRHLLDVGGFDEAMPSTIDRDMAIRLLLRGEVRWAFTRARTVEYYVDAHVGALSTPGSHSKAAGLRMFYASYAPLMSDSDRRAFFARARKLFGVERDRIEGSDRLA